MKLTSRRIIYEDYDIIVEWWKSWPDWVPLARNLLPEEGTGGIMIERDGEPLIAGFLYSTNSKICWMEWIVSDPKQKNKSDAIVLLISSLEEWAVEGGFELILSIGRSKSLIDRHKELGYTVDSDPSYEIIKKIK
tara:strand:+ start:216 stop:620 length:405 start_codon:yes stop_codon:yes gene_type:complete